MSDKVIDLEKARERLRSPSASTLDYEEEIVWAEEEMESVEEEINEIGETINSLTNYILELATYLGAITVAKDCDTVPEEWVKVWTEFKTKREAEEAKQEEMFEIIFEPEVPLEETDDN
tara:strand:- start:121 stop:477 length:357 start_codon:yes stop_codon:yes gene_type:complete